VRMRIPPDKHHTEPLEDKLFNHVDEQAQYLHVYDSMHVARGWGKELNLHVVNRFFYW